MRHHQALRELAKFGSGLVVGDFLYVVWIASHHLLPVHTMGITFTQANVAPALVVDVAIFAALVHYGWHLGKMPRPRERTYLAIAGVLFTVVALAHLWRAFFGASLVIGSWAAPVWLSWVATAALLYLAYASFYFASRER